MGGQIGLLRDPDQLLQKYRPDFSYSKTLCSAPLVQTLMCTTQEEGQVVCKFFLKDLSAEDSEVMTRMQTIQEKFDLIKHPNVLVLVLEQINDEKIAGQGKSFFFAYRQFVYYSLQEKIRNRIPLLSMTEKKWFILQLLCAVSQVHQETMVHGDIKPENILITSYNQLFLTDLVSYKPSYIQDDDLKNYNLYYGELDNNQRSYLAPERLREQYDDSLKGHSNLKKPMDIFSVGCVIAEILMDGSPLFDLARLQQYRKGAYCPRANLERKVHSTVMVDLIMKMIELEPSKRPQINDCLLMWNQQVLPQSFSKVFFQLSSSFLRPQYLFSDMKISLLRKFMPSIWRGCFDNKLSNLQIQKKFCEPIEKIIFEKLREDSIMDINNVLIPSCSQFEFIDPSNEDKLDFEITANDKDSAIIFIQWIGTFIGTCFFPQTRRCALEMLLVIARASSLEIRLQYILPYVFKMFDDKQSKVRAKAIEVAVLMFENIVDSDQTYILTSTDFKVFDNYIMPQFNKLQKSHKDDQLVQVTYTRYLPLLAKIGHRFTELSVTSRLAKKQSKNTYEEEKGKDDQVNDSNGDLLSGTDSRLSAKANKIGEQSSLIGDDNSIAAPKADNQIVEQPESPNNRGDKGSLNQISNLQPDHVEVFVNYDQEIDSLRKTFVGVISDYAVRQDTSIERLLFSSLGSLCDFFGSKVTMDNLIPLLGTCSNKKEFLIKLECLKSVTGVGIKVGKQTLSQYMLLIYTQFLHDSEELVVLEIIRTLSSLLKLRLISKATLLDDFQSKNKDTVSHHLLDKLLPFLLHPNTWIREETLNFILVLSDHENTKLLTKAEVFCVIRRKLKPYLQDSESANLFLVNSSTPKDLLPLLRVPLSRNTFESMVKSDHKKFEHQQQLKLSDTDKYALDKLSEVIAQTQKQYQQDSQMRADSKQIGRSAPNQLSKRGQHYNQYRVIKMSTILSLAQHSDQRGADVLTNKRKQDRVVERNTGDYYNEYFEPCKQVKDAMVGSQNYGINSKTDNEIKQLSEIDMVMQALGLLPDDAQIPLIEYTDSGLFTRLANQSLPEQWRLQVEKISSQVAQPTEIPQFHNLYSRTTSVPIETTNAKFMRENILCDQRSATEKFRPQGRLITTLYEHKYPVNSIAVTDDQSMFFTASRQDGMVHGWSTKDIERDATSHSRFTIESQRQLNQICTLSNSEYFCVAGTQSGVDIYEMARLSQDSKAGPGSIQRNVSLPGGKLPTHTAIVKTLEHKGEGDMMCCFDTMLPVSHQHLLAYTSQRGSLFMHDLRCRRDALQQRETFAQQRGMITCMSQGQDPYQILCGSIGGYVMVYDIRFNVVSTSYKHNQKYPINSIATFKPQSAQGVTFNRCTSQSPMVLVAAGGPAYELSLLNLDSGNIEILMSVNEGQNGQVKDQMNAGTVATGIQLPSFNRESLIRDCFAWPEKSETNQSLYRRYLMQTKSLVSPQQIKLTQNLDDELFKASRNRYKLVKQANESTNACRKVLIPRRYSNLLQGTWTADYAITGGNDMRLRYWKLTEPAKGSYYINTPSNDECQHFSETLGGGVQRVQEQISRVKNFPAINANMLHPPKQAGKLIIPNTDIEMRSDSIYYSILANMIQSNSSDDVDLSSSMNARKYLTQGSINDMNQGPAHQYQIELERGTGRDKITVYNYNGLSEWQHLNGLCGNEGNATLYNSSYNDMWSQGGNANSTSKQGGQKGGKKDGDSYISQPYRNQTGDLKDQGGDDGQEYLFRESHNVSHSDTILDMAILEVDYGSSASSSALLAQAGQGGAVQNQDVLGATSALPLLITCSRDCTIKLWR